MFEVGESYMFYSVEHGGGESYETWTVEAIELPLLKLSSEFDARKEIIFNTASSNFVRAEHLTARAQD
jgi:hypothetical protein